MSLRYFILLGLLFTCLISNAQVDAIKIASAKKSFESREYQFSIDAINEVSKPAQKNKICLYYKGYSFYKLNQFDSAEVYLKKYLLVDVTKEDVSEALIDIDYKRRIIKKYIDDSTKQKLKEDEEIKNILGDALTIEEAKKELIKLNNIRITKTSSYATDTYNYIFNDYLKEEQNLNGRFDSHTRYVFYSDINRVSVMNGSNEGEICINTFTKSITDNFHQYSYSTRLIDEKRTTDYLIIQPSEYTNQLYKLLSSIARRNNARILGKKYYDERLKATKILNTQLGIQ